MFVLSVLPTDRAYSICSYSLCGGGFLMQLGVEPDVGCGDGGRSSPGC